ncbi:mucin-5AC-like [Spea bombifrons]|uniref:mucin-5AC-like n=1 Tax=Spea bombifrons TaxID=233779 RepID=UPI00234B7E29|nr:mucin-5AC-like [Spea bombifrons]
MGTCKGIWTPTAVFIIVLISLQVQGTQKNLKPVDGNKENVVKNNVKVAKDSNEASGQKVFQKVQSGKNIGNQKDLFDVPSNEHSYEQVGSGKNIGNQKDLLVGSGRNTENQKDLSKVSSKEDSYEEVKSVVKNNVKVAKDSNEASGQKEYQKVQSGKNIGNQKDVFDVPSNEHSSEQVGSGRNTENQKDLYKVSSKEDSYEEVKSGKNIGNQKDLFDVPSNEHSSEQVGSGKNIENQKDLLVGSGRNTENQKDLSKVSSKEDSYEQIKSVVKNNVKVAKDSNEASGQKEYQKVQSGKNIGNQKDSFDVPSNEHSSEQVGSGRNTENQKDLYKVSSKEDSYEEVKSVVKNNVKVAKDSNEASGQKEYQKVQSGEKNKVNVADDSVESSGQRGLNQKVKSIVKNKGKVAEDSLESSGQQLFNVKSVEENYKKVAGQQEMNEKVKSAAENSDEKLQKDTSAQSNSKESSQLDEDDVEEYEGDSQSKEAQSTKDKTDKKNINQSPNTDRSWYYQQRNRYDQSAEKPSKLTFIAPTTPPVFRSISTAHNGQVCSTWGNYHFKTFDGDIYHYPGTCNYLYASNCKSSFEEFNIQIRRSVVNALPTISHIIMKIDGIFIELTSGNITFNGEPVELPFSFSGVQIDRSGIYIKVTAKLGLEFMWNEDDAILLELDKKFANTTCGLCGDFNGIPTYNEFIANNVQVSDIQFGNMQKLNGPTERCQDVTVNPQNNCTDSRRLCEVVLTNSAFSPCNALVDATQYIEACVQDLCRCAQSAAGFCLCNTFTEYSRQCAHAGGRPRNWRTSTLCPLNCNYNMQYKECGSACPDTCTNSERSSVCNNHCIDGCVCPEGTVFDDINNSGCIPKQQCSCTYNGRVYAAGTGYSEQCQSCSCAEGKWKCVEAPCSGSCSVEGGSHITSYDATRYTFHGDCSYVLSKTCNNQKFSVLGELRTCGLTDTETCLKSITLILDEGKEIIYIQPCGSVFVNYIFTQLPVSSASATIFKPSTFYIIVQTKIGIQLQIQLSPMMQVYINVEPSYKNTLCGLCGNFNRIQADDFRVLSGVTEGTGSSFANTWKVHANCPNVRNSFENPCSLSIENEQYAIRWCSIITEPEGPFAECHMKVNPTNYKTNCMFDTCNCANSEECLCAAVSSYVHACSRAGIIIRGWRKDVCNTYTTTCPRSFTYSYNVNTCQRTCRSLSEHDITCDISFVPIDGCVCQNGTYLDDTGKCVLPTSCPCFYKRTTVLPGEVVHDNGAKCTCTKGKLDCIGQQPEVKVCDAPMIYFDCTNKTAGTKGSECQKSCQTLDMQCYSTQCASGCVCPHGLVADGNGGCVREDDCPCLHNNEQYSPGSQIKIKCNSCTCKNRMWECTNDQCMSTCSVYGDGHYLTFDNKRYRFNGNCEYTLVQDYCGGGSSSGSFRIITETVPCGTTGTTCSKSIKLFLGNYEIILAEDKFEVVQREEGEYIPYKVHQMGLYMVIEAQNGLALVWDKKTSIYIKLESSFQGKVCGLCGNYDGNAVNDFTTRSLSVVGDVIEFGNSWKLSPSCLDSGEIGDPCSSNPFRKAWSQRQCSIITSSTFLSCHSLVDPLRYYEACVNDACACDTGGDCECFCTAVASYAQACSEAGVCVSWRTPTMCPVFCDYYNLQGQCEWHYKACGAPCMKTCRNPTGICYQHFPGLEGCYPNCPEDRPFFDEDKMQCVPTCNCYDKNRNVYIPGQEMPNEEEDGFCTTCKCTKEGRRCSNETGCCLYEKKVYRNRKIIYTTTDGIGGCIRASCVDGEIERYIDDCSATTTTVPTTTFSFSTTTSFSTSRSTVTVCSVDVSKVNCSWSKWYDVSYPVYGNDKGDIETFENIRKKGFNICDAPRNVECRAKEYPEKDLKDLKQDVTCNKNVGLICLNRNNYPLCYNYQIRVECCYPNSECTATETTPSSETPLTTLTSVSVSSSTSSRPTPVTSSSTTPSNLSTTIPSTKTLSSASVTTSSTISTPTTTSTTCPYVMECRNTTWFDNSKPSNKLGGEFESLPKLRSSGYEICTDREMESRIMCEVVEDSGSGSNRKNAGSSSEEEKEVYTCDLQNGLVCLNSKQKGFRFGNKCSNYRIRVECCAKYCEPTPSTSTSLSTSTSKPTISTTTSSGPTTTTSSVPTTTTPSSLTTTTPTSKTTKPSSTTPVSSTSTPYSLVTTSSSTSTPATTSTTCPYVMECRNTTWFDNSKPSNKLGGEFESLPKLRSSGYEICTDREMESRIMCEVVEDSGSGSNRKNAGSSSEEEKEVYTCDLQNGLVCLNSKQKGFRFGNKCSNYRIRVECCAKYCEPTPSTSTSLSTSTSKPTISTTTSSGPTTTTSSGPTTTTPSSLTTTTPSSKTTKPSSTTPVSSTSTPYSLVTTSSSTSTPATTSTTCPYVMECRNTTWFDNSKPSNKLGGEFESLPKLRSSGYEICTDREMESRIMCEVVEDSGSGSNRKNAGSSSEEEKEVYTCDLQNGLVCLNSKQKGFRFGNKCSNYRIRVECCAKYCEPTPSTSTSLSTSTSKPTISTTTSSGPTTTTSSGPTTTTPSSLTTTTPSSKTTKPSSTTPVSSTSTPYSLVTTSSSTSTPATTSTTCPYVMECRNTTWFDNSKPSNKLGGEFESLPKLRSSGYEICTDREMESRIMCEVVEDSGSGSNRKNAGSSSEEEKEVYTCDLQNGLVCLNSKQKGFRFGNKCSNYRIRVECCAKYCEPTPSTSTSLSTSTSKPTISTTTSSGPTTTTSSVPTTTTPSSLTTTTPSSKTTKPSSTTPVSSTSTPYSLVTTSSSTSTPATTSTTCPYVMECRNTTWFDNSKPSNKLGGEFESLPKLRSSGYDICTDREMESRIMCEVVENSGSGSNRKNAGSSSEEEKEVYTCDLQNGLVCLNSKQKGFRFGNKCSNYRIRVECCAKYCEPTPSTSTSLSTSTSKPTISTTTSSGPTTTTSSVPTTTTPSSPTTTTPSSKTTKPTSTTPVSSTSTPYSLVTTSSSTSTPASTSTTCPYVMECRNTTWFDNSKPSNKLGGEFESLPKLRSSGYEICTDREMESRIMCEVVEDSGSGSNRKNAGSSSEEEKEVYTCDLQNGLVCLNSKQKGFLFRNKCSNYRIRVECCAKYCEPTPSTSTSLSTSTSKPTISTTTSSGPTTTTSLVPTTTTPSSLTTTTPSSNTTKPTSTTPVSSTSTPYSLVTTSSSTSTPATTSTTCPYVMECRNTTWFDNSKPSNKLGGEFESLPKLRSSGYEICTDREMESRIMCEVVEDSGSGSNRKNAGSSSEEEKEVYTCDLQNGLVCLNSKQKGFRFGNKCSNYRIRVECCAKYCEPTPSTSTSLSTSTSKPTISTTTSSGPTTTTSSVPTTTTPSSPTTTTPSSKTTKSTSTTPVSSTSTPYSLVTTSSSTSTPATTSTTCPYVMECRNTTWFDNSKPSNKLGGEFESLPKLRSSGYEICTDREMESRIMCEVVEDSGSGSNRKNAGSSSEEEKEVYTCDLQNGLVCLNSKQKGFLFRNKCSNYRIRVECCAKYCEPTPSTSTSLSTSTSKPTISTTTSSGPTTTTSSVPTTTTPSSLTTTTPSSNTTKPTSTTPVSSTSTPYSLVTTSSSTSTPATTSTTCPYVMECRNTTWFDNSKPSNKLGGEFESLPKLRSSGYEICTDREMESRIMCEVVENSGSGSNRKNAGSSSEEEKEVYTCDLQNGLVCLNSKQKGFRFGNKCSNYRIRVECCAKYCEPTPSTSTSLSTSTSKPTISTTTSSGPTTTTSSVPTTTTPSSPTTTTPSSKTTKPTSTTPVSSTSTPYSLVTTSSSTSTPATTSTTCPYVMECRNTTWFDNSKPSNKLGGEFESLPKLRSSGYEICTDREMESRIMCEVVEDSGSGSNRKNAGSSSEEEKEVYTCDLQNGLVCLNSKQKGFLFRNKCSNYRIRVECCAKYCEPTPSTSTSLSTSTSKPTISTTTSSGPTTTTSSVPTTTTPSRLTTTTPSSNTTKPTSTTPVSSTSTPYSLVTTSSSTSTPATTSTTCPYVMECRNTTWFDNSKPSNKLGGEFESLPKLRSSGYEICTDREMESRIMCEVVEDSGSGSNRKNAGSSSEEEKEVYTCDLQNGLVCLNSKQKGFRFGNKCSNYRIRVECCAKYCEPTPSTSTSLSTSTSKPTISTTTSSGPTTTTSSVPTTTTPSSPTTTTPSSKTTKPTSTTPVSSTSTPYSLVTTSSSTSTPATTSTTCPYVMECRNTTWFDNSKPSNKLGGEFESLPKLRSSGYEICTDREMESRIMCEVVEDSGSGSNRKNAGSSSEEEKEVYTCDLQNGLVCLNSKQKGFLFRNKCSNYRIRVECCAKYCEPTPSTSTSLSTSTSKPTISTTTSSGPTTTTSSVPTTTTPSSLTTTTPSSNTTKPTSTTPVSSTSTPYSLVTTSSSTSTPATSSTTCPYVMECRNTTWFDNSKPSNKLGGEFESLPKLRSSGYEICTDREMESRIMCEVVEDSGSGSNRKNAGSSSEEEKEVYTCDLQNGLVCLNSKQKGFLFRNKCSNYRIRVECCAKYCEPTPSTSTSLSTSTSKPTISTTTSSGPTTTTSSVPTTTTPSSLTTTTPSSNTTKPTSTTPVSSTSTPYSLVTTSSSTSTPATSSTTCPYVMECRNTTWFDNSKPSNKLGGEFESLPKLRSSGYEICTDREMESRIMCEVVEDSGSGSNRKNAGSSSEEEKEVYTCDLQNGLVCLNSKQKGFLFRNKCSNYRIRVECCAKYCEPTPSTSTSLSTSTSKPTISTTTSSGPTTTTSSGPTTTTSSGPTTTTPSSLTTTTPSSKTTKPTSTPPVGSTTTPYSLVTTSSSTSTPATTSTSCPYVMECRNTTWFDNSKPSDKLGGEFESLSKLRSSGYEICTDREMESRIMCEVVEDSGSGSNRKIAGSSSEEEKEVYTCDLQNGLVCLNSKQKGFLFRNKCSNYRIRVECCAKYCEPTPRSTTTSLPTSVTISTSTPVIYSLPTSSSTTSATITSTHITVTSTSGTTSSPVSKTTSTTFSTSPSFSITSASTTVSPSPPVTVSEPTTISTFSKTTPPTSSTTYPTMSISTSCFCQVNESLFSPGDIIYRTLDKVGCEYYAKCGVNCTAERFVGNCASTTVSTISSVVTKTTGPTTSANTTSVIVSTVSTTVPVSSSPSCGECVCQMPKCETGYRVYSFLPPGACCVNITCVPDSVCVVDNNVYQRGSIIPQRKGSCQTCLCSNEMDKSSEFYAVKCQPIECKKTCSQGYVYKQIEGQCCGECVPLQCTMKGEENTEVNIKIGDTYRTNYSTCSYYECNEENGVPILTKVKKVCQNLDLSKCDMSTLKYDEDGCCKTCQPKNIITVTEKPKIIEDCSLRKNVTVLKQGDCETEVELSYCGGPCMGSSMYSMAKNGIDHKCTCCTEMEVGQKTIQLLCADGLRKSYTYIDVLRCGCAGAECTPDSGLTGLHKYSKESYELN